ncbi:MAG: Seryl-tRNA synthetase, partial [uncultured Solirubrobacteraceae bacterium]
GAAAVDRGGDPAGARDPLPRGQHRGVGPRRLGGQEVRLRGVAARPGALPRADLDVEHHRLPGPAPGHPLPLRRRVATARVHAQRDRRRGGPHDDRVARERSARGRHGGDSGGSPSVGGSDHHSQRV